LPEITLLKLIPPLELLNEQPSAPFDKEKRTDVYVVAYERPCA